MIIRHLHPDDCTGEAGPFRPAAVLFDLDGTLVDTAQLTATALIEAAAAAGHELTAAHLATHNGGPLREWLCGRFGLTPLEVEPLYRDYVERIKAYAPMTAPLTGAESLLRRLTGAGIPMAIVTTRLVEIAVPIIAAQGWTAHFQLIVGQETAARPKPAPDPALYASQALGIDPENAAMVGDTEADVCCASAAGIGMIIGLVGARSAADLLNAGASAVCDTLAEVESLLFEDQRA